MTEPRETDRFWASLFSLESLRICWIRHTVALSDLVNCTHTLQSLIFNQHLSLLLDSAYYVATVLVCEMNKITCTFDGSVIEKNVSWNVVPLTFFTARARDEVSNVSLSPDTTSLRPTVSTIPLALVTRRGQRQYLYCMHF